MRGGRCWVGGRGRARGLRVIQLGDVGRDEVRGGSQGQCCECVN